MQVRLGCETRGGVALPRVVSTLGGQLACFLRTHALVITQGVYGSAWVERLAL